MSVLDIFEEQWMQILETGQHSEQATISLVDGTVIPCSGIYFSGTFKADSVAPYTTTVFESKDMFQVSVRSLKGKTWKDLKNAKVSLPKRGKYVVADISGKDIGNLTLMLRNLKYEKS